MPPKLKRLTKKTVVAPEDAPEDAAAATPQPEAPRPESSSSSSSSAAPISASASASTPSTTNPEQNTGATAGTRSTKPKFAFKPNTAQEAKAKQTKDSNASEETPMRERRDPTQRRPRREMLPRTRIEDTMVPSNLAGNLKQTGSSKSKFGSGGGGSGSGSGPRITQGFGLGGSDEKVKLESSTFGFNTGNEFDENNEDVIGKLDERDILMIADSFAVGDEDAPVSLGWSRKVRDREHFFAGKNEVKADEMDQDGKEMQSFNEFVQPELPRHLPHFEGIEGSLTGPSSGNNSGSADVDMSGKSEGLIGKILVHRSGKMKLVLGDITLDVDVVPYSDVVQEAVAVDAKAKTSCILGRVSKRFICTPDINDLLNEGQGDGDLEIDEEASR
ncbi:DNA-directed RNA polymerase III subunit RPC4 [Physocladia obscura]|uniref:DNA-directed RNA polymerase III subunit RPC4 n=1 Tax=Physocladia obscura TaxID=109957 RepID=A0AAD5T7B1_9FUNG|nr:DNA-directed RNA polymerase III subunit RPC4 [Physocladia obscura]